MIEELNYIDSLLNNGKSIVNVEFLKEKVIVENSEAETEEYKYTDTLEVRVFKKIRVETLNDLLFCAKNKKVYVIHEIDSEKDAIFNSFPENSFQEMLKKEEIEIEVEEIEKFCNGCWGFLVGKEKEITFSKLRKIIEE